MPLITCKSTVKKSTSKLNARNKMAKSQSPTPDLPPPLWSPDDLPRLAEQLDRQSEQLNTMHDLLASTVDRLNKAEAALTLLDPERVQLPAELTRTLNLSAIYTAAIQGAMTSMFLANPQFLRDAKYLRSRISEILNVAEEMIVVTCDRHGLKGKVDVKS